jgi:prepilin-type N-terminal cleavage/methylation domain-containing protein
MRTRIRHSEAGISLQELLIAMAILGIIAAFTVPNFNAYMKVLRGQTQVNEMVGAMNLGRQMAVTTRDDHLFVLTADPANTWQLLNVATTEVVDSGAFPDGVTAEVGTVFQFDSSGACVNPTTYSGGSPDTQYLQVEAVIQGANLDRYTLEVAPTGKLKSTRERVDS